MAEHDFVRADSDRQVADRRLADLLAVNRDFGPWDRVDRDRAVREIDLDRRDLARRHLNRPRDTIAERLVLDLDLVPAGRHHQPVALARADQAVVLVDLHFHRRRHGDPSRHRRITLGRGQRHDQRRRRVGEDRHRVLDRSGFVRNRDDVLARGEAGDRNR